MIERFYDFMIFPQIHKSIVFPYYNKFSKKVDDIRDLLYNETLNIKI